MATYKIKIEQRDVFAKYVTIEANSPQEAVDKVEIDVHKTSLDLSAEKNTYESTEWGS